MGVAGFVVVAGVAVKWFVREERADNALAILRAWHLKLAPGLPRPAFPGWKRN